jgi:predicted site-specific integrase-resolvase
MKIQEPAQPAPKLFTARQLAEFFSVSSRTIGRWRQEGLIPYIKTPGGTYRYDPLAVEAVLMASPAEL